MNHFEAVVLAAGVCCVYNADDWERATEPGASHENGSAEGSATQH